MITKKIDSQIVVYLFIVGLIVFFIHFLLLRAIPILNVPDILFVHPFMFILTIITIVVLNIIFKKAKPSLMGYAFLGSSFFKMMIAVLFLIPILKENVDYKKIYVVQFFMIYFIYLAMEVIYLVQQLKNKKK
ncbi:MAG: hypothetical protein LBQ22_11770 [Bacteroidales bacterium]|jgi:hypothetical protein|nr:hypothetical protein [Bacteroidales bacterium]